MLKVLSYQYRSSTSWWRWVAANSNLQHLSSASHWNLHAYPLVNIQKAIEHGPVEIVDFPINSMVIVHCILYVHQRVTWWTVSAEEDVSQAAPRLTAVFQCCIFSAAQRRPISGAADRPIEGTTYWLIMGKSWENQEKWWENMVNIG